MIIRCPMEDATMDELKIIGVAQNDAATCRGAVSSIKPRQNFLEGCINNIEMHTPNDALTPKALKNRHYMQENKDIIGFKRFFLEQC